MKGSLAVNQLVGFNVAAVNVEVVLIDHLSNVVRVTYRRITAGGIVADQNAPQVLVATFQQFEAAWAGTLQLTVFALLGTLFGTSITLASGEAQIA